MRTTVTLDPDYDMAVRWLMRGPGLTFKQAANEAIRQSFASRSSGPACCTTTFSMGAPRTPIDKALRLAAELEREDEEIIRKLAYRA
jgi:hypothetical protein